MKEKHPEEEFHVYFLLNGEAKHTQGVRWMVTLTKNSGAQLVLIERNIIKKEIGVIVQKIALREHAQLKLMSV